MGLACISINKIALLIQRCVKVLATMMEDMVENARCSQDEGMKELGG